MIDAREFKTTSVHNIDPRYIPAGPANEMQFLSSSESFTKKFTGASEIMARLLLWLFWWCPSYLPAVPGPFGRKKRAAQPRTAQRCAHHVSIFVRLLLKFFALQGGLFIQRLRQEPVLWLKLTLACALLK